jgi:hypothetical protein
MPRKALIYTQQPDKQEYRKMNNSQADWAAQHDWFVRYTEDHDGDFWVTVKEDGKELDFDNFQELRDWAGY